MEEVCRDRIRRRKSLLDCRTTMRVCRFSANPATGQLTFESGERLQSQPKVSKRFAAKYHSWRAL